ncbi:MAG: VWA domain-containing protein, partial [Bacteroidetes bacterium]|nr:VWA domain-containing protein [Bacteroidota bacterium]
MVFDASDPMAGDGNAKARQTGNAFIDLMDGILDEAAIIWFSSNVTVAQKMTSNKPMLYAAIDALPASGSSAWRDGAYAGILELINDGVNVCRAVVIMTAGADNASSRTLGEVIALADRHRIRVFTIGIGNNINAADLETLARLTGGRYYQTPNTGHMSVLYDEIAKPECIITYERDCADGSMRTVELQLVDFCDGTDMKEESYRAPLDSATFTDLYMELGQVSGKGNTDIAIPLNLITPIDGEMCYPFEFNLQFDSQCLQFKSVTAPPGSLLEGSRIDVVPAANGTLIRVSDGKIINGNGKLMELTFTATSPLDTVCCAIEAIDASFDQGCFIPIIDAGEICILPLLPEVTCTADAPVEVVWDENERVYDPSPFPVDMRITNTGDREAGDVRFRISYDADVVELVAPLTDVQTGTSDELAVNEVMDVRWQVAAKHQTGRVNTEICIVASFDNHPDVTCCSSVEIAPGGAILACDIDVPEISPNEMHTNYEPMPFPVTVTVTNTGGQPTDEVFATITAAGALTLVDGEAAVRLLTPAVLFPGQQGQVQWMLQHPPSPVEQQAVIQIWVRTDNVDSVLCKKTVILPALDHPSLVTITPDGPVTFCEGDSVTLDAGGGYASYLWSTGEATRSIVVHHTGRYYVTVWNAAGAYAVSSPVTVQVHPLPPIPEIHRSDDVLSTGAAESWQWFRDGMEIPGATAQCLPLDDVGVYMVRVTNSEGCERFSDEFTVSVLNTDMPPRPDWNVSVHPEPNTGAVVVEISAGTFRTGSVAVYDIMGRQVSPGQ